MSVTLTHLADLGFIPTHIIELDPASNNEAPVFRPVKGSRPTKEPSVYLWIAERVGQEKIEVLYVGKAGKGVEQRSNQHQAGFRGSVTGRKNALVLLEILSDVNTRIRVFARRADTAELFGTCVSLYSSEEEALCAVLRPRLNRQIFPKLAAEGSEELPDTTQVGFAPHIGSITSLLNDRLLEHQPGTVDDAIAQMEEVYSAADCDLLKSMLLFVENELLGPGHRSKLIKGYTDQLHGCNGVTTLTFGEIGNSGKMKGNSWVARIYLGTQPRIGFPVAALNPMGSHKVEMNEKVFAPVNIQDMFRYPQDYLRPVDSPT
ncbi:hypothetical protein [Roseicyclus marinus]|uniref:hypothetical protein n=1 Tax=Roseicyclus marinus TaxID=2161673 RepID=UPI00240F5579|nr:hypothetical protein [Roseicyclus marinus]MDG3039809.1 hypothetical protein [Roseicyclus marinus]